MEPYYETDRPEPTLEELEDCPGYPIEPDPGFDEDWLGTFEDDEW
jgi:hypothetical protein